jgi:5-methylcytosine-specific restriction protein A
MNRPFVWQMIKEAIETLNRRVSYSEIRDYINHKWSGVNQGTITAQIIVLTVNHASRIHYPENHKPRLTNSNSPYDLLFNIDRGEVEKYNPNSHGVWQITSDDSDNIIVKKFSGAETNKIYTPSDIIWFKNVTNKANGEAYLDIRDDIFVLNFPTIHKTNVLSPQIDELIVIRQKVDGIPVFTHLVTPIDNELIDDSNSPNYREDYRYGRRVKVIAKVNIDDIIPISSTLWKRLKFGGITQGNVCKIENISNVGNVDELLFDVWQRFAGHFITTEQKSELTTNALINEIAMSNPDITVIEGELRLIAHLVKERNRTIVKEKKKRAMNNGTLFCEVCAFSFRDTYNSNFIECHHTTPIGQFGVRETSLDDLALVCSNCHRMLHTKFDGRFLLIKELQDRVAHHKRNR